MNYVWLSFILYAVSVSAMQNYSRLESLPTDHKLIMIKHMIRTAQNLKQARLAVYNFIIGDRNFRNNNAHVSYQTLIEDYLGWYWNDETPLPFIPDTFTSHFFETLPEHCCDCPMKELELLRSKQNFDLFCNKAKEGKSIPENILHAMDLYHRYTTEKPLRDTTLSITWVQKRTPLHVATEKNNKDAVEQLLVLGCDTQALSDADMNPLHLACKKGYKDIVALFIKHNIPLNAQTRVDKKTAMHIAAEKGHMDIMHMLESARADRNIKDSQGYVPAQRIKGRIAIG